MSLRKPCPHDRYEEHPCIDGRWVSQARMMKLKPEERPLLTMCPGGEFLPEGAIVIEKVDGEWPHDVIKTLEQGWLKRLNSNVTVTLRLRDSLDALAADQVGEPGRGVHFLPAPVNPTEAPTS